MKMQRSTLILGLCAALALGGYGVYQGVFVPRQEKIESQAQDLFSWAEGDVKSLKITTANQTLVFQRRSEDIPTPWDMVSPKNTLASDASISFLLNLLTTESSESTVSVAREELANFGLDTPTTAIEITLADGTHHKLLLGNQDFSNSFLYSIVESDPQETPGDAAQSAERSSPPEANTVDVRLVTNQFEFGVNRQLEEWTYTPPPEPSPSPNAGTDGDGNPEPPNLEGLDLPPTLDPPPEN